jgi:NADH:ubiquinone oxidoreductase subunit 6 (subunit J)
MISFAIISLVMLAGAAAAMMARDVIYSALCLILTWLGVAAFYLWIGVEFVAFAQVLVYVGAVSMVVVFAVLLTRASGAGDPKALGARFRAAGGRSVLGAVVGAGLVGLVIARAIQSTPLPVRKTNTPSGLTVREIGEQLTGAQAAALLLAGLLLTVALIGGVVLAAGESAGKKRGGPS